MRSNFELCNKCIFVDIIVQSRETNLKNTSKNNEENVKEMHENKRVSNQSMPY